MVSFGFILSCWKHCEYVNQCVDSILMQPYRNKKVILYGESCQHNIAGATCINDGERRGRVARLNIGANALGTDYISFFGVDDYLLPNVLDKVAATIEQTGKQPWYYGRHLQLRGKALTPFPLSDFDLARLRREDYIAGGAVFLRRDIALRYGFYGMGKAGFGDDWIMWYRAGSHYPPVVMDMPIYVERIGTTTTRAVESRSYLKSLWSRRQYKFRRWLVHMHLEWLHLKGSLGGKI